MKRRTLVCSELLYKAYEPAAGYQGLRFPVEEVLGRPVSSPNRMARMFDEEYGTDAQQLDLVIFLDGHESSQSAKEATLAEFRESWPRPKWHIFMQGQ